MIKRYQFQLDTPQPSRMAYPLYAVLLEQAPGNFSSLVHDSAVTPVSQYVHGDVWSVSLFGDAAIDALSPVLDELQTVFLRRDRIHLQLSAPEVTEIFSVDALLEAPPADGVMQLLTPTAFKSGGVYHLLPTQRLVLQNLMLKWNGCFGGCCPIEDEGGGLEAMAEGLVYRHIRLDTDRYQMKRVDIPGAVGSIELENRLAGFHRVLANALLTFGTFSGVGIKTALGMGGMSMRKR